MFRLGFYCRILQLPQKKNCRHFAQLYIKSFLVEYFNNSVKPKKFSHFIESNFWFFFTKVSRKIFFVFLAIVVVNRIRSRHIEFAPARRKSCFNWFAFFSLLSWSTVRLFSPYFIVKLFEFFFLSVCAISYACESSFVFTPPRYTLSSSSYLPLITEERNINEGTTIVQKKNKLQPYLNYFSSFSSPSYNALFFVFSIIIIVIFDDGCCCAEGEHSNGTKIYLRTAFNNR